MRTLSTAVIALLLAAAPARAADAGLVEAARKDGRVVWYTTQILDQFARPAAAAFEKKYGVKVEVTRADSNEVALRVLNEGKAGHMLADVFDGTAAVATLKKADLVMQWTPEDAKRLPSGSIDADNYWVGTNLYVLTPGFNTDLVPKGTEPKTRADLLDPKWKGRIAWDSAAAPSGAGGFVGLVLTELGEEKGTEYLEQLSRQNIAGLRVAARQVLDQVIAGEYSIALNIFNNHAVISAAKGAPVDWIPMSPTLAVLSVVSVTKTAPHPAAGKLLVDFLVSEEGQKLYRDAEYMPIDPATPTRVPAMRPDRPDFRAITFTPEQIEAKMPAWAAVYQRIFR